MSQVLVDSSVWVEMFRRGNTPVVRDLERLVQSGLVCTCGLVLAEILSGARTNREFHRLEYYFSAFPALEDPSALWQDVARTRYRLARKGFQSSIADLIVAVTASFHGKQLLTLDRAFEVISGEVPVRLFRPVLH